MENLSANWAQQCSLRVYILFRQPLPGAGFWQRHFGPNLSQTLLQRAKDAGINQALLLPVQAGYLGSGSISHLQSEHIPTQHPLCLELVDSYQMLMSYIEQNRSMLAEADVILLNTETFKRL